jgi:surface carbohydrate biosynthesis protein
MGIFKVLCFVDDQQGRDVEMLLPLVYHAEKYLACEVEFLFVWDIFAIYRKKPDLIILANTIGSKWHFEIAKYAHEQNITVFALLSEGNFRTNGTFNYWGYNSDKKFYQEYFCHWSERTRTFLSAEIPDHASRMVLTGAVGFDRYRIYQFPSKQSFLHRKGMTRFRKVIGYAGWAFGKVYSKTGQEELKYFLREKPESWMEWTKYQMLEVESVLRKLIEHNSDTLFLLKVHPNETHPHITRESPNEMYRLKDYPNVWYIKNEENIHDLIAISDIWMGFETTTAIEAWMLNKETVLINPDPNFARDPVHSGSVIAKTFSSVQSQIDEFYSNGFTIEFNKPEKSGARKKIIEESIGFADGLNHLRAAYYLNQSLLKSREVLCKPRFNLKYFVRTLLLHIGSRCYNRSLFLLLPRFKKTVWAFDRCKLKNISRLKEIYTPFQDEFYRKNGLSDRASQIKFWKEQIH